MITDLIVKHLAVDTYTLLVQGNLGEEEAVISISPGQDGDTRIIFTAMQCDGGAIVRYQGAVKTNELPSQLRTLLHDWAFGGLPPKSPATATETVTAISRIVSKAMSVWGVAWGRG